MNKMRIQLSLDQNTLRFYGEETTQLRVEADDELVFAFPVITNDFVTSGTLRVMQSGRSQSYPLVNSQATVPAGSLVSGPFTISASSNLYSTNELEFHLSVSYTGNEMSPIVNKQVHLNENQINIYNEDNSQFIHFIMPRYYDGVDLSEKTCRIHWYSPENNVADYDAVQDRAIIGDNIVFTWLVGNELTQYEGNIQFVVEFIGTDYVWKSKICEFTVENSLADTGGLTPAPTTQWYNSFVVEMDGKVATAEAWATGQKDGTDVPDTDPAYHNNAKYYAEQAADEADRAGDAADHAEEVVDHKAEIDGYYQEMSVGGAEQLISAIVEEDHEPYNFRTAGGSIDIGDRLDEKIVGGTVAWNQHFSINNIPSDSVLKNNTTYTSNGVTFTKNNDNSITIQTDSSGATALTDVKLGANVTIGHVINNHKHLITGCYGGSASTYYLVYSSTRKSYGAGSIFTPIQSGFNFWIEVEAGTIITTPVKIYPQIIDLEQCFGTSIADYIYSLETATAGAGVAWFKKLFPKPYYAYNAGALQSVKTSAHKMVGFNQWDEEWEVGTINNSTGANQANSNYFRSKNYIPVIPNTTYHFKTSGDSLYRFWYDADKNYLRYTSGVIDSDSVVASDAYYMRFVDTTRNAYDKNTKPICINLHWDGERDGEYEPYVKHEYALDPDLELRGIPKLDTANKLIYDGDIYESNGKVTRNWGQHELSELTFGSYVLEGATYYAARPDATITSNALSKVFGYCTALTLTEITGLPADGTISFRSTYMGGGYTIIARDDSCANTAALITKLTGKGQLIFALATPTEEQADPYTNPQIVDDFGTEEYVDAGVAAETPTRDVSIPVGHDSGYQPNLRAKLEMAPDSPGEDGYYVVHHHDGINEYTALIIPQELPEDPTEDGTYTLKCTVVDGTPTLSWEQEV